MRAIGRSGKKLGAARNYVCRVRHCSRSEPCAITLAELRHGMIKKSLNPFRISLGNRRVYTTFAIELKTLR
jgi:hypothetical protein